MYLEYLFVTCTCLYDTDDVVKLFFHVLNVHDVYVFMFFDKSSKSAKQT